MKRNSDSVVLSPSSLTTKRNGASKRLHRFTTVLMVGILFGMHWMTDNVRNLSATIDAATTTSSSRRKEHAKPLLEIDDDDEHLYFNDVVEENPHENVTFWGPPPLSPSRMQQQQQQNNDDTCDWCSRIECVGQPNVDQTCRGWNLYQHGHTSGAHNFFPRFYYFRRVKDPPLDSIVPTRRLSVWGGPLYYYDPFCEKVFDNTTQALEFIQRHVLVHQRGIVLALAVMWTQNMAHAMFDAFYPAIVGLSKFFAPDNDDKDGLNLATVPFRPAGNHECTSDTDPPDVKSHNCKHEYAMRVFAANDPHAVLPKAITDKNNNKLYFQNNEKNHIPQLVKWWNKDGPWTHFEQVVIGSTNAGEYCSLDLLPASERVLKPFVERLMVSHGVTPRPHLAAETATRTVQSQQQQQLSPRPLRILFTESKRFTQTQQMGLKQLAAQLSRHNYTHHSTNVPLEAVFLNWGQYQTFGEQMQVVNEADILVTNRGTSMFWCAYLRPGSACVLMGTTEIIWPQSDCKQHQSCPQNQTLLPGSNVTTSSPWKPPPLPHYGEEAVVAGNRYIHLLYLPLQAMVRGWTANDVRHVVLSAVQAVLSTRHDMFPFNRTHVYQPQSVISSTSSSFPSYPYSSATGFSLIGQIFRELLARSPSTRRGLEPTNPQAFQCHLRVGGQANFADIVYERPRTVEMCGIDLSALRQVKREYGLAQALGVQEDCECVVCVSCGTPTATPY